MTIVTVDDSMSLDALLTSDATRFEVAQLRADLEWAQEKEELRAESFEDLARAYDEMGWKPLSSVGWATGKGLKLDAIKNMADTNEQLLVNPLIKRAVRIRNSYVFGEGIRFGKLGEQKRSKGSTFAKFQRANKAAIFSKQACEELETALCTAGNLFLLLDKSPGAISQIIRVPISEISGIVTTKGNIERKLFIQRTWSEPKSGKVGDVNEDTIKRWYPIAEAIDTMTPDERAWTDDSDAEAKVDWTRAVVHISVNRQLNWLWGMADLQPVVFWAKAYKEALESQYVLLRALSKWALKVTAPTATAAKRAAAKIAAAPSLDAQGRPVTSGATAALGGGEDLQAISKAGANVDFDAPQPLAAMVAAGMEVSLEHLLSNPEVKSVGAETLAMPTVKAMSSRQAIFRAMYETIFNFFKIPELEIVFPPIQAEPIHRIIQAIVTAASTNALHPKEIREMVVLALRLYGVEPLPTLPEAGAYQEFVTGINPQAQADAELAAKQQGVNDHAGTSPQKTPDASGKKRSPAGALADGDHEQRSSEDGSAVPDPGNTLALLKQLTEIVEGQQ